MGRIERARAIVIGFGQVGKGTLDALLDLEEFSDGLIKPVAVATRRPEQVRGEVPQGIEVYPPDELTGDEAEIALLATSSQDLWYHDEKKGISNEGGLRWAKLFRILADTYDNHGEIKEYIEAMRKATIGISGHGFGWDPGQEFSTGKIKHLTAFLRSATNILYGPGMSQGHSTALREDPILRELDVLDAVQNTVPYREALEILGVLGAGEILEPYFDFLRSLGLSAEIPSNEHLIQPHPEEFLKLTAGERMWRDALVLTKPGADLEAITKTIQGMKDYFEGYATKVTSVNKEVMAALKQRKSHQGIIVTRGKTRSGSPTERYQRVCFGNNAEATGGLLASAGVGLLRAYNQGIRGSVVPGDLGENLFAYVPRQEIISLGM